MIGEASLYQSWRRLGLRILPHGGAHPLIMAIAAGLACGALMALSDAALFRSIIPSSQTALVTGYTTAARIAYFVPRAVVDEIEFRLLLMSAMILLLTLAAGKQ